MKSRCLFSIWVPNSCSKWYVYHHKSSDLSVKFEMYECEKRVVFILSNHYRNFLVLMLISKNSEVTIFEKFIAVTSIELNFILLRKFLNKNQIHEEYFFLFFYIMQSMVLICFFFIIL